MKWPRALTSLLSCAALLMPLPAVPESAVQTGPACAALSASAHVRFKIVIPEVLSLGIGAHGQVILSAAARKAIAPEAVCAPRDATRVVCTVSMP